MIVLKDIIKTEFHFIMIRGNRIKVYVQPGKTKSYVVAEITDQSENKGIIEEIEASLLAEPWSYVMELMGNLEYMKEYCFKSTNLVGKYIWMYYDPKTGKYQGNFDPTNIK